MQKRIALCKSHRRIVISNFWWDALPWMGFYRGCDMPWSISTSDLFFLNTRVYLSYLCAIIWYLLDCIYSTEVPRLECLDWSALAGVPQLECLDWSAWSALTGVPQPECLNWSALTRVPGVPWLECLNWSALTGVPGMPQL